MTDWNITLADNGRTVTSSGPTRFSGTRTISNVNVAAHTFTISGAAATTTGATTLTIDKPNANATINDGTLVLDPAVTAGDVGRNVSGTGIQTGATVLSVTPGQSFVMSLPATQTKVGNAIVRLAKPDFSNPVLFNNIFWNNDAMTVDQFSPGATLVDQGFIDYEIRGTTNNNDTFTPRFSDNTNNQILGPNGVLHALPAGQANRSGGSELRDPVCAGTRSRRLAAGSAAGLRHHHRAGPDRRPHGRLPHPAAHRGGRPAGSGDGLGRHRPRSSLQQHVRDGAQQRRMHGHGHDRSAVR